MPNTEATTLGLLPISKNIETNKVLKKAIGANRALAELKGAVRTIPDQTILINALSLQEAKDSSEIENIITTHDELYRAEISTANIPLAAKEVQRYREALYRGFELVSKHKLLLQKDIVEIQQVLEGNNAGIRTQSGTVLKNEATGEVIYTPPQNKDEIDRLMSNLEQYINDPDMDASDPLVKMAVIHYQFESIHPFYDGNGRTGRIINILYLVLQGLIDLPVLYLSSYIIQNKADYYRLLGGIRTEGDWESWVLYMLDGIEKTSIKSVRIIEGITRLMEKHRQTMQQNLPKIYSKDMLEVLFRHPYTKINLLMQELDITRKTAASYLNKIEKLGLLKKVKIGREIYFVNTDLFEMLRKAWDEPQEA